MTDRPIIFSAPMILAFLAGRKTMTRRLAWRKTIATPEKPRPGAAHGEDGYSYYPSLWQRVKPGDRLWVREGFCYGPADENPIYYRATDQVQTVQDGDGFAVLNKDGSEKSPWRSALHMPRWASRLTLIVTAMKIERLQNITEAECIAEGAEIMRLLGNPVDDGPMVLLKPHVYGTPRTWFRGLWDQLHGAGAWDANPELVALTFTVHKKNIDAMRVAA